MFFEKLSKVEIRILLISRLNACRIEATLETFFEEIFPEITQLNVNFNLVITQLNVKLVSHVG